MQRALAIALAVAATAACRLDPLVEDQPGASGSILPSGAPVPSVTDSSELLNQITLNDSLDTKALAMTGGVIVRGTGFTSVAGVGTQVPFWAFGEAERAPAPIYILGRGDPTTPMFQDIKEHPPLVGAVPGDGEYEPVHTIYRVQVTDKYAGEKITTTRALADAVDIGLVQAPVAIKQFVNWPIVRPGLRLEVGGSVEPIAPTPVYGHGHMVDSFPLGGALGTQPNPFGLLPTSQVSFVRAQLEPTYNTARPIFQASVPTAAPSMNPNYTPVSVVVN
ncbi:MAG TPA: hypothetical protein VK601_24990, partial [Kofleriaceae bacterium]|nr:hypothetical protein [Kofleriaceae bacterium]